LLSFRWYRATVLASTLYSLVGTALARRGKVIRRRQ
jgi:hypothetical protein